MSQRPGPGDGVPRHRRAVRRGGGAAAGVGRRSGASVPSSRARSPGGASDPPLGARRVRPVSPRAYSVERSRAMTATGARGRSHAASVGAVRSGSRSTTCRASPAASPRSTRIVPYVRPRFRAQSSTPSTRGVGRTGSGARRTSRSKLSALVGMVRPVRRRAPASPPTCTATRRCAAARRRVRWAWRSRSPRNGSANVRRAQRAFWQ